MKKSKFAERAQVELSSRRLKFSLPAEQGAAIGSQIRDLVSPLVESAALVGDYIRFYRYKATLKAIRETRKIAEKQRIELKVVPPKFFIQWLEAVSLEEDEDLLRMWSNLLLDASANPSACKPIFVDILKKMGASEANVIEKMWRRRNKAPIFHFTTTASLIEKLDSRINKIRQSFSKSDKQDGEFWKAVESEFAKHLKEIQRSGIFPIHLEYPFYNRRNEALSTFSSGMQSDYLPYVTLAALQVLSEGEYSYEVRGPGGREPFYLCPLLSFFGVRT